MTTPSTSPAPGLAPAPPANGTTANGTPASSNAAPNGAGGGRPAARYEVLEREGQGTMWVCYRVRDRATGAVAALKALQSTFARHPRFAPAVVARLQREVSLRAPGHALPHLAAVYEAGLEEGTPYFVTDWLPGHSLEVILDRAARRPLERAQILDIARALAQALETLHAAGLAHGDLRPRQVRPADDGRLRVLDSAHAGALHEAGVQLTDVIGDAAFYQAPERWDNRPPSPSADLYALGVILYRALSGRLPFEGPSPLAIAMRHRRDAPLRPSQFNAQAPRDLEAVAMRLLEKDPAARYPSATRLLHDLSRLDNSAASTSVAPVASASTSVPAVPVVTAPVVAAAAAPVAPVAAPVAAPVGVAVADDDEDEDEEAAREEKKLQRRQRRREFWGALGAFVWMVSIGGVLGAMVVAAYRAYLQDIPRETAVPEFRGKGQETAKQILAKRGLKLRVAREVYDPRKPSGTVLSGEPGPGKRVRVGREIAATVSRGPEPIRMYDFRELTLQQARTIVARDGLRLGMVMEQYHDTIPAGFICGQYPEAGEPFRRSEPINLTVSRGEQPGYTAPVPDSLPTVPPLDEPTPSKPPPSAAITTTEENVDEPLIQHVVQVRVAIPSDASAQEVRVVARDADGQRTVYRRTHQPGEEVQENVQVTRPQGGTATVFIYVGGALFRKISV